MMNKRQQAAIFDFLDELFPEASCELVYNTDFGLLIAVILSAQATDKSVNLVTPSFFNKFPTLESIAQASLEEIAQSIRSIGLYKTKARNIQLCCQKLILDFGGRVPADKTALLSLPGVGPKTANVIRAELFNIPEIAVDTHVNRVAKRLYFAASKDTVDQVEQKLRRSIPENRYIKTHHQMIHFGRYFCKAQSPRCQECKLRVYCRKIKEETI